jgi:glycerol dehydrogenase-like iron-containing ADH family enzyme
VIVDAALIRTAPAHLNRGGVGDILSIHTALYDWRLAHARTGEPYDAAIAQQSASLLERLRDQSREIYAVSDAGVHLLTELFCEEVYLCLQAGSSRPEEGSEHHLLYTLEYLTGRTYLHGAAVTLCALVMAHLQGKRARRAAHAGRRLRGGVPRATGGGRRGRAGGGGAACAQLRPRGRLAVHCPDGDAHYAGTRASGGSVGAILVFFPRFLQHA